MNKDKIDFLDKCLTKTNDWVKFAETKNGILIALASSIIFGIQKTFGENIQKNLTEQSCFNLFIKFYLISLVLFMSVSLLVAIYSFIPRLKMFFWVKNEVADPITDNPLYFAHAYKYAKKEKDLLSLFDKKLGETTTSDSELIELNYCNQIITNSEIAVLKFEAFRTAAWLFLCAVLTPVGAAMIYLFKR